MQKITSIHAVLTSGINAYQKQKRLNPKIHLVVNEYGMPINFIVTNRSRVDRAYNTNEILSYLNKQNIKPII